MNLCTHECVCSVQFSRSVVSDSLWPHELQHARAPRPSPTPRVHPNSCTSSRWCHLTISSSVIPFSSCLQSFPALGSFQMCQLFASDGQNPCFQYSGLISSRMDWFDLLAVQGTLKSLLQHCSLKASVLRCSAFFTVQFSHPYTTTGKTIALNRLTFCRQSNVFVFLICCLLFNMLLILCSSTKLSLKSPALMITFLRVLVTYY